MKKVYECIVSELSIGDYNDFDYQDGLVDHVIDPFGDDEEPLNLLDNAVKLEKGQEALFKVTVTTTVELIDVRAAPPPPKPPAPITYGKEIIIVAPENSDGLWCLLKPEHVQTTQLKPKTDDLPEARYEVKLEWVCERCGDKQPSGKRNQAEIGLRVTCAACKLGDEVLRLAAQKPKSRVWKCLAGHVWPHAGGMASDKFPLGHNVGGYCIECRAECRWVVVEE